MLRLPPLHPPEAGHRDGRDVRSSSQHDTGVGQSPRQTDRLEDDDGVRHLEGHAMPLGARPAMQVFPRAFPPAVDSQRVGGDHSPAAGALHDRCTPGDGDCADHLLGRGVDRNPVPNAGQARQCDRRHYGQNRQHHHEFSEGKATAPPPISPMRRGLTLAELVVVLAILAIVTAITLPRLAGVRDWIAVDTAAQEVIGAIAVARSAAIMQGTRSRAVIGADSLRIDRWWESAWEDLHRWPGPERHGVALEVSNPVVVFEPIGLAWGLSNTSVVLRRGTHVATITVSRLGRVKRW